MSDQQSDTETVDNSATQLQQQEEGNVATSIDTDPSGTDQGDSNKSPTIAEKEKSKGPAPATPNTSSVDDAARKKDRPSLTLSTDGQGPKNIVTINVDGNEDDAPMDSPAETMDTTVVRSSNESSSDFIELQEIHKEEAMKIKAVREAKKKAFSELPPE